MMILNAIEASEVDGDDDDDGHESDEDDEVDGLLFVCPPSSLEPFEARITSPIMMAIITTATRPPEALGDQHDAQT